MEWIGHDAIGDEPHPLGCHGREEDRKRSSVTGEDCETRIGPIEGVIDPFGARPVVVT